MKLLTKTILYFLAAIIPLLVVAGIYLFQQFSREINSRSDKELISNEIEWIRYLQGEADNGTTFILKTPDVAIFPTNAQPERYPKITDANSYHAGTGHTIPYRQLQQVVAVNDVAYQIFIRQSQEQKAALVTDVTRIMLFVFIGLFLATLIFNWAISKRLWAPFRQSLYKIRSAELQKIEALHFDKTSTREFNELNASLNYMTGKMYRDYLNMKEFTENAAHEMQTPIAVAQSKLELLLQDSNLTNVQVESVLQASDVLSRLSKLSSGLLLLAKIENNQYDTNEEINLTGVIEKYIRLFDEFISEKRLQITMSFDGDFIVKLHPLLADSLITNLLGNAIKYNYEGGSMDLISTSEKIEIVNTSRKSPIEESRLFSRLHASKDSTEKSNGLGLAIVKKIADLNGMHIRYTGRDGKHFFTITKNNG